jgi:hypothetical protein
MNKKERDLIYQRYEKRLSEALDGRIRPLIPPEIDRAYRIHEYGSENPAPRCHLWFIVQQETFRIYASWTVDGSFPVTAMPVHSPIDNPRLGLTKDEPKHGRLMFNAPLLWSERKPRGWELDGLPIEERLRQVDEAVGKVVAYVIPYFDRVLKGEQ